MRRGAEEEETAEASSHHGCVLLVLPDGEREILFRKSAAKQDLFGTLRKSIMLWVLTRV